MPNDNKNLCLDGKLNVAYIKQAHPLLAHVFDVGLKWTTWKKGVEALYPSLPDIAQRALNSKHSTQQGQDEFPDVRKGMYVAQQQRVCEWYC